MAGLDRVRIDKWLWAARFFKTRSLATNAVDAGHIRLNGERPKPAKDVKAGDTLHIHAASGDYVVDVIALSDKRGSAVIAQSLYAETDESKVARALAADRRKTLVDPSEQIVARPTKKDRRNLDRFRDG